ncbi:MAG: hypothetical protein H6747_01275 [Deltaproteobacteria bacterium]|nr:hypothetical protein [Deltaproteobacteria bacterium]
MAHSPSRPTLPAWLGAALVLLATVGSGGCRKAAPAPKPQPVRAFVVQPVWFAGLGDGDRPTLDRFLHCLIEGSNLASFWDGAVALRLAPSVTLPAPATLTGTSAEIDAALGTWIGDRLEGAGIQLPAAADATMVLLVFAGWPQVRLAACGHYGKLHLDGREVGLAVVRTAPHCWPTGDVIRSETQIAAHEIVEDIDKLLGYAGCSGDGACEGSSVCPDPCGTFVGLACPGAPTASWTGCGGGKVDGWVIQRFSREGRKEENCHRCTTCEFTPQPCPGAPGCIDAHRAPGP